jgi:hypothetical protein
VSETNEVRFEAPEPTKVLYDLGDELSEYTDTIERVTVERAADWHYVCRVYFVGKEDFDAFHIRFDGEE